MGGTTAEERALILQWMAFSETMFSISPRGILHSVPEGGLSTMKPIVLSKYQQRMAMLERHFLMKRRRHVTAIQSKKQPEDYENLLEEAPARDIPDDIYFLLPSNKISAADCCVAYSLALFQNRLNWDLSGGYPNVHNYLLHMSQRKAFQKAWEYNNDDLRGPHLEVSSDKKNDILKEKIVK